MQFNLMLSEDFIKKMRAKLEEEKKTIEEKILKIKKPEKPMDNPDLDDLGHDAAEDILEGSLLSVHESVLERIDNALGRMADGTYGICLRCGKKIKQEDLEKELWAEHCRVCGK